MNPYAYRTTDLAIKTLSALLKARVNIHDENNIPQEPSIFTINHFTRIETFLLPSIIYKLTKIPVWSLASADLFKGNLGAFLEKVGALSTKNPNRDRLMVKTLLQGDASWIIYPEGRMVKNKKVFEKGRYMITHAEGKNPPHTGAASLAIRSEFYRQRLHWLADKAPSELNRLLDLFDIDSLKTIRNSGVHIVPVNITYYPIRGKENALSSLAQKLVDNISDRMMEEIMTEGTMLLSGVDVDMRFGKPIDIGKHMVDPLISRDIRNENEINFDDSIPSLPRMRKLVQNIMNRYMSDIYQMTTVNPDHLFASMLKLMPKKIVGVNDLKRRVFLSSTKIKHSDVFFHKSLSGNHIHILTDDRHGLFKDFMSFAREKGILETKGNYIIKNVSRLVSDLDFHHVRIENPISVMANEIEPLTVLKKRLRIHSFQPAFWIKRKVARYLLAKAQTEFNEDYKKYFHKDESKKMSVGKPFLMKGRFKTYGILLIHGYMAAPKEVKSLAQHLKKRGFWVYAVRLKGHGTSPEDLACRSYNDWINSVDEGYTIIRNLCQNVVIGGFSTGAALALDLATRVDDASGVFAVSTPLRLQHLASKLAPAVDAWNKIMEKIHLDEVKMEFIENKPENPQINYLRNPISGVKELESLMSQLEPKLSSIKIPTIVLQDYKDPVVDEKGSKRIFELIGSKRKELLLFNFGRHGILLGKGSGRVHRIIGNFIVQLFNKDKP